MRFITMMPFCDLAEALGLNRQASYNAFGGDRGKYPVEPARTPRAAYAGLCPRLVEGAQAAGLASQVPPALQDAWQALVARLPAGS